MKTIKVILFAVALLIGVSASAQDDKKLTLGVKAGANMSNVTGDLDDTKVKIGFNVGVTLDYAFTPEWFLMTGLEFTTKGLKQEGTFDAEDFGFDGLGDVDVKLTYNPMYLQLPIHAGYKLEVADNTKINFHAGPYLAYGIGGKITAKAEVAGVEGKEKTDIFGDDGLLKRFDFGVGLGAGVEFGKIGVGLGYDFGLVNIIDVKGASVKNSNAYLTVGYKF